MEELIEVSIPTTNALQLLTYDAVQLLSVLLLASVLGPKNVTYIPKIQGSEHAGTFAEIIKEVSIIVPYLLCEIC